MKWISSFLLILIILTSSAFASSRTIVFAHGMGVPTGIYSLNKRLTKFFKSEGYRLLIAKIPAQGTIEKRAAKLNKEIRRLVPFGNFHLIGHSMGGLDARLALNKGTFAKRCLSLTTMATPHLGSKVADYVAELSDGKKKIPALLILMINKIFGGKIENIRNLTTTYMRDKFNFQVSNLPRVDYYSTGYFIETPVMKSTPIPWAWLTHKINVDAGDKHNDGLVSTDRAKWGTYLGSFPGDHWAQTAPIPYKGKIIYKDVFKKVIDNLKSNYP
ncbi:MAG: hypothetical protein HOE90_09425 [Bacteriovoracaceae bacterium]|jgi:triacylglycerol lipase|nr:hypothetical protein [Bacteriovoracaceae bacterium]